MDAEALIVFTTGLARRDPRLFDEMLDWLALNHRPLSMQRLRNLADRFPIDTRLVGAVIAWIRGPVPSQLVKGQPKAASSAEKVPVFSPDVLGFIAKADPTFEEYGFIRPPAARSGKSREPDTMLPANLAFRLRHLFGPGSRSEVIRVLLTYRDGPLDAARIADESAFAKRNASEALTALAAAEAITANWWGNGLPATPRGSSGRSICADIQHKYSEQIRRGYVWERRGSRGSGGRGGPAAARGHQS
jgi:hypothetical protein